MELWNVCVIKFCGGVINVRKELHAMKDLFVFIAMVAEFERSRRLSTNDTKGTVNTC